ncbi:hypothetical protein SELMODRAFT_134418, partial [Selaginella moellendorffii]
FNITSIPDTPVILGLPWFEAFNPEIDWITCIVVASVPTLTTTTPALISTSTSFPIRISLISLAKICSCRLYST